MVQEIFPGYRLRGYSSLKSYLEKLDLVKLLYVIYCSFLIACNKIYYSQRMLMVHFNNQEARYIKMNKNIFNKKESEL